MWLGACKPSCIVSVYGHDDEHRCLEECGDDDCAEDASKLPVDAACVEPSDNDESANGVKQVCNESSVKDRPESRRHIVGLWCIAGALNVIGWFARNFSRPVLVSHAREVAWIHFT